MIISRRFIIQRVIRIIKVGDYEDVDMITFAKVQKSDEQKKGFS